ncbi:MAG: indolepyruvate oxidoreductase subunit beta [Cuniculiplasma sp.]
MIFNIILMGVGGQGIVTSGILIADAAKTSGINAVMSEVHGLSQRGGSVRVDLRLGDVTGSIVPKGETDLILGFEPMEAARCFVDTGGNPKIVVGDQIMVPISLSTKGEEYPSMESLNEDYFKYADLYRVESSKIALEAGNKKVSNMAVLGGAFGINAIPVPFENMIGSLESRFHGEILRANNEALNMGREKVRKFSSRINSI